MKIGVCEKDLRGSLRENLSWLARNGFAGFQVWQGHLAEDGLSGRDLLGLAGDLGLEVSAVGGGPNLVDPAAADESIRRFRGFLDLSVELGCRIVTAETKAKPAALSDQAAWASTIRTVGEICRHAETVGAVLAIECSGPCFIRDTEMWQRLAREVGSPALKVNYDPANIVWAGRDPVAGLRDVADHIVHTHAKDIIRRPTEAGVEERLLDVPAGEGLVGYPAYLRELSRIGYRNYLTIEMHAGTQDRRPDILAAAANLRRFLAEISPSGRTAGGTS